MNLTKSTKRVCLFSQAHPESFSKLKILDNLHEKYRKLD